MEYVEEGPSSIKDNQQEKTREQSIAACPTQLTTEKNRSRWVCATVTEGIIWIPVVKCYRLFSRMLRNTLPSKTLQWSRFLKGWPNSGHKVTWNCFYHLVQAWGEKNPLKFYYSRRKCRGHALHWEVRALFSSGPHLEMRHAEEKTIQQQQGVRPVWDHQKLHRQNYNA